MRAIAASVGNRVSGWLLNPRFLALAFVAVATLATATVTLADDPIVYTLPTGGFGPANITALGVAAIGGWSGYLAVVLPIALLVGLTLAAVGWFMGVFHAKKTVR